MCRGKVSVGPELTVHPQPGERLALLQQLGQGLAHIITLELILLQIEMFQGGAGAKACGGRRAEGEGRRVGGRAQVCGGQGARRQS